MNFRRSYKLAAVAGLYICSTTGLFAQTTVTDGFQTGNGSNNQPVTATWQPSLVRDGAFDRTPHVMRTLGWQPLREVDILWKKRVWREIDTREKQNQAFRYPGDDQTGGGYFIEILLDAVKKGKIKAYSTFDDRFTQALTKEQIMEKLVGNPDTIRVIDPISGKESIQISNRDFNVDLVTLYRVKEDWMFDRNLGRMVVRIIAIAPLVDRKDDNGNFRASTPLFWLYYPEARPVLAQYEVFNPENDVQRLTWDDYLEGRYWKGRIIQVSNVSGESFKNSGYSSMESLYEDQKTNEKIFDKEHDMWVY